jgi:excinuclease UvrABC nuclease subunit
MSKKKVYQSKIYKNRDYMTKGVYYLYHKHKVVYIGMSTNNCYRRILNHFDDKEKEFDSFQIFAMPHHSNQEVSDREKNLIKRKLPKYNKVHASSFDNKYWKTEKEVDKLLEAKRKKKAPIK